MNQTSLLLLAVGVLLGAFVWAYLVRAFRRFRLKLRFARAQRKEAEAALILEDHGYTVLASQLEGSIDLVQDGEPLSAPLRADYLVEKKGRTFIAEAKSGSKATNVLDRGTRRQLLEYLLAYEVDGVLLVNTEEASVSEVFFPVLGGAGQKSRFGVGVLVGVGLSLSWLLLRL